METEEPAVNDLSNNDEPIVNTKDGKTSEKQKRLSCRKNDAKMVDDYNAKKRQRIDNVELSINSKYVDDHFIENFSNNWKQNKRYEACTGVELYNEPFKITILQNFLQNTAPIDSIVNEMATLKWFRKQMDLYEFHQTNDLSVAEEPFLQNFYQMLINDVRPWMEKLTGVELTHVSASCSMYNHGDHLLVHDDLLTDRVIAYVFYLSPWPEAIEWSASMGGALEIFPTNDNGQPIYLKWKEITPKNNQFVFFEVSSRSFHQVGEVTNLNYPRLTINGWFHGKARSVVDAKMLNPLLDKYCGPNEETIELNRWINESYLEADVKKSIQEHIEINSEACLELFLDEAFFESIEIELKSNNTMMQWTRQGPCNHRNYECLQLNTGIGPIIDLVKIMSSPAVYKLFYELTELDFSGPNASEPKCSLELCRLTQGCYSLLGSHSKENNSLDVVLYFNARDQIGLITYLNPEDSADDDGDNSDSISSEEKDSVLLTLQPKNNALNLVYRSEGTTSFIKYISKSCIPADEFVYVLIASYVE